MEKNQTISMKNARLWEVDSLRGAAILMMLLSNFLFDLFLFKGCQACYSGFWFYFARATAFTFVLVAGISLTLSHSRSSKGFSKYLKRGLRLFGYGMLITAVSFLFLGEGFVVFGILHLIGLSVILTYPFLEKKLLPLFAGILVIILGFAVQQTAVSFPWLVWLGLRFPGFVSVDYAPLLPWFGVALLGVFLGNTLFPKGKPTFKAPEKMHFAPLSLLGRNSLFIYLVHQPVFVSLVLLLA